MRELLCKYLLDSFVIRLRLQRSLFLPPGRIKIRIFARDRALLELPCRTGWQQMYAPKYRAVLQDGTAGDELCNAAIISRSEVLSNGQDRLGLRGEEERLFGFM